MTHRDLPVQWDMDACFHAPTTRPAEGFEAPGVQSLFFENEPYRGKPTRVFAWMGLPYIPEGATCPGMVLLHGGGGTAFEEWVQLWNRRGYAAIAIDQCGCVPERPEAIQGGVEHARHSHGGPAGWNASFDQTSEPLQDQWQYHAVAAALRAHSLLAAQPGVDPSRIGVTGISWGGYLTSIMAGVDERYKLAVPVYGCGFLGEDSVWKDTVFPAKKPEEVEKWLQHWDPSHYLKEAECPVLWVSGTNDFAYPLDSLVRSAGLPKGKSDLCVRVEMPHSHPDGWAPDEIGLYADEHLCDGTPLPRILTMTTAGDTISCEVRSTRPILRAEITYTRATGHWSDRKYRILPAVVSDTTVSAPIPKDATVAFLTIVDDRGCVASSRYWEKGE